MFAAKPHPLLVPYDGTFDARVAATAAPDAGKEKDWKELLEQEVKTLGNAQHRLFADGRYAVLIVFQALDAAGKDSTIRHVFSAINPCGLHVTSFKQPSRTELAHDFLWRTTAKLPERGSVAIFNRSYYEEVLVVRVHPELLAAQNLPGPPSSSTWGERQRAIAAHEHHLAEQGTVILKFWLNVSRKEQRKRFLDRIDDPSKNWKFRIGDLDERERWNDYLGAYHDCLNATSRPWAPWYAIPADDKHYMRWQVAQIINSALEDLHLAFPQPAQAELASFEQAKTRLGAEKD